MLHKDSLALFSPVEDMRIRRFRMVAGMAVDTVIGKVVGSFATDLCWGE